MSIFELHCPLEPSDQAFKTSMMSICPSLAVPVIHACFLQATISYYAFIDVWTDFLLNNYTYRFSKLGFHGLSSHESLAYSALLFSLVCHQGWAASLCLTQCYHSVTQFQDEVSSCLSDIVTNMAGLNVASASHQFVPPTDLVTNHATDVMLVHPFNSSHHLKEDFLTDAHCCPRKENLCRISQSHLFQLQL
jgi:hypothetical protein